MADISVKTDLSDGDLQRIADTVIATLRGQKQPRVTPAALKAAGAARYLAIGRSTFYNLLKADAALMAASSKFGASRVCTVEAPDE